MFSKPLTRAPRYILIKSFFLAIGWSCLHGLSDTHVFKKIETTVSMRWNCMPKALRFIQITAEHFTVFITIKTSFQNISITLLQISLKLTNIEAAVGAKSFRERFWNSSQCREMMLKSKIGKGVISLILQLRCHCNPDHNKFSSSSTTVVAIFTQYMNAGLGKQTFTEFWHVCLEQKYRHAFMFSWRCCSKSLSFICKFSRNKRKTKEINV